MENTEPRTFATVLRAQQSMVFSIAYHFLRDHSAAEEVAQDVFLELHKRFDQFESELAHIVFWLRKVAGYRSIDYVRKPEIAASGRWVWKARPRPRSTALPRTIFSIGVCSRCSSRCPKSLAW